MLCQTPSSPSLSCRVFAPSDSTITWAHNGASFAATSGRYVVRTRPSNASSTGADAAETEDMLEVSLDIGEVVFADEGDVVVTAKNASGWVTSSARIIVGGEVVGEVVGEG